AYFADYNLAYGRDEGDRLLRQVAAGIRAFVARHAESFAGRRTGAEFAVFVPGASAADVRIWAEQLVQELDGIYSDLSAPMDAHVHAGLAVARPDEGVRALLAAADEALRAAQQREESCSLLFPDSGVENHHNMETWRTIIAQAIREDNLSLWLQPMVHGDDQSLVHYQVFSRIDTAEGALKAGLYVPVAERLGLLADIDRMLIARALECLERHPERALAVSLGSSSVASKDFRDNLVAMLAQAGGVAARLWVGIAEVTIHHHRKAVSALVRELSRLGVPVLVDRFGVGGVPFSYLKRLPFRAV